MTMTAALTPAEHAKRDDLTRRKPYIAKKLRNIAAMEERGEISPIIRLEKSYLCNFQCTHCSAEFYMDRHLEKVLHVVDERTKMTLEDVARLSREADALGLARFVITGGEPLVMKDFDEVVAALDPERHYIITDTNGWFLDRARALHLKAIGVEKVQLSLDSFEEQAHDAFRNKPGSHKRVMLAIDAALEAGLNLLLSTVLVKGRARTEEFRSLCSFAAQRGVGLYVSYAKPTGSCTKHPEFVITKEDADAVRELEKEFPVFTHMTPSYGSFKGCIANKGIITVTSTLEVTPCPYIDFSLGNLRETPLIDVLRRGMRNPWLGPYRPDCLIGEDPAFIRIHTERTQDATFLPLPYGQGFSDDDTLIPPDLAPPDVAAGRTSFFDEAGRCLSAGIGAPAHAVSRQYFQIKQPLIDYQAIHRRTTACLGAGSIPGAEEFRDRIDDVLRGLAENPEVKDVLRGVYVPFMLPQGDCADIGQELESRFIPAVERAFSSACPDARFSNHVPMGLAGTFAPHPGSRHDRLLAAMGRGPVVGCYFPALTEYSPQAARERVASLPDRFLLAGGFDTCAALIATPNLLCNKERYAPLLWMSGLTEKKAGSGHHFEAYGRNLTFNKRMHFDQAAEYWCNGLVVLG
jgi:MoaA/NifB/PqqE/SkfB family radical SAM enzyme